MISSEINTHSKRESVDARRINYCADPEIKCIFYDLSAVQSWDFLCEQSLDRFKRNHIGFLV